MSDPTPAAAGPPFSTSFTNSRSRKQLSLFAAGASFFCLSALITRRSLTRRYKATLPRFYQPSNNNRAAIEVNGATEAVEALTIATVNVSSFMMMMTGGFLWAFDVSSLQDLRRKVRGGLGVDGSGRSERVAEEEFEEWLATVIARKEEKRERREGGEERRNERGKER